MSRLRRLVRGARAARGAAAGPLAAGAKRRQDLGQIVSSAAAMTTSDGAKMTSASSLRAEPVRVQWGTAQHGDLARTHDFRNSCARRRRRLWRGAPNQKKIDLFAWSVLGSWHLRRPYRRDGLGFRLTSVILTGIDQYDADGGYRAFGARAYCVLPSAVAFG